MGNREWPVLDALKVAYCAERGLDPAATLVEYRREGGTWVATGHSVVTQPRWAEVEESGVSDEPCGCPERAGVDEALEKYFAQRSEVEQGD